MKETASTRASSKTSAKKLPSKLQKQLEEAGFKKLTELLLHLPRRYEDRRNPLVFEELEEKVSQPVLAQGVVERYIPRFGGGRRWLEAVIRVPSRLPTPAYIYLVWFHKFIQAIQKGYPPGTEIFFTGKMQRFQSRLQIVHPEMSKESGQKLGFGEIIPIYPQVEGITPKKLRETIRFVLDNHLSETIDPVPEEISKKFSLVHVSEALSELHHPTKWNPTTILDPLSATVNPYFKKLVFDEFFYFSLGLEKLRKDLGRELRHKKVARLEWKTEVKFPFELTGDQVSSLEAVKEDFKKDIPMHRLIQGDVGSGKTAVAFSALIQCAANGHQGAMLAPTQILATQHFENFCKFFPEFQHQAVLLTGALKESLKKEKRADVKSGSAQFVFGTQALLSRLTQFDSLALVVVDEQHRFGVEQRRELASKSKIVPHLLVMTATPIPRSLALTLYGDLDVSVIREKPKGRGEIKTYLLRKKQKEKLAERLLSLLSGGHQAYIVYPLVEDSELLENVESVTESFKEWTSLLSPHSVGLLHGKMKAAEKDLAMNAFRRGEIKVLVSTTVIEVGVDVPNATLMIIENAERFGLSQLHQLRGRVGRGAAESVCALVVPDEITPEIEQRLNVVIGTNDGFKIAEADLVLRGPGDFLGVRQSGSSAFKTAHLIRDLKTLEQAKQAAKELFARDPELKAPQNSYLAFLLEATSIPTERLRSG
ncbi:MAG: ATP-dependent DNA helicase RecG [Bdellovibrionota bacterium]